ncbi:hypothetical protein BDN72DRAFT_576457 [Pluteus cervinus]|uniref:Uncharacterized protein n=1 Tax=Pluteus cervinus TaxID=181527 RepID=A0ACD3AWG5_9AGAR|nr:hypothetical protein BDN72DRAFT_576457 [Pluteus cervinus]
MRSDFHIRNLSKIQGRQMVAQDVRIHNFLLDTVHHVCITMGTYRYFVTDYANPTLLNDTSNSGGTFYFFVGTICSAVLTLIAQLFFVWRLWAFSIFISQFVKWVLVTIAVAASLTSFGSAIAIDHLTLSHAHTETAAFMALEAVQVAFKVTLVAAIVCDVVITSGMILNLHRSRTGLRRTNEFLNFLVVLTLNTGLTMVILAIVALVSFYVLAPRVLLYLGIELILARCYVNSLLGILNSRDYLRERLNGTQFHITVQTQITAPPEPRFQLGDIVASTRGPETSSVTLGVDKSEDVTNKA